TATSRRSTLKLFPTSTPSLADSLASLSLALESGKVSTTQEARSFLTSRGLPVPNGLACFSLRMSEDSPTTTKGTPSSPSRERLMNWGTTFNGRCLTAKISPYLKAEIECSLSEILEARPDPKFFLSSKSLAHILRKSRRGFQTLSASMQRAA